MKVLEFRLTVPRMSLYKEDPLFIGHCDIELSDIGITICDISMFQDETNLYIIFPSKRYEYSDKTVYQQYIKVDDALREKITGEIRKSLVATRFGKVEE